MHWYTHWPMAPSMAYSQFGRSRSTGTPRPMYSLAMKEEKEHCREKSRAMDWVSEWMNEFGRERERERATRNPFRSRSLSHTHIGKLVLLPPPSRRPVASTLFCQYLTIPDTKDAWECALYSTTIGSHHHHRHYSRFIWTKWGHTR